MRALVLALSLLLALAPLGLAQDGHGSSGPEPEDECDGEGDNATRCTEPPSPTPAPHRNGNTSSEDDSDEAPEDEEGDARLGPGCRDGNRTEDELRRCRTNVERIEESHGRAWIAFQADPANATLRGYTIGGLLAFDALTLDLDGANLTLQRSGSTLFVRDGEAELRLHDEPNGLIRFKGQGGNVTLVFPAGAAIERAEHGARIAYADGREGHLLADNATWLSNQSVQLNGFFAFHVPPAHAAAPPEEPEPATEAKQRVQQAIERRNVGAEVTLRAPGDAAAPSSAATAADAAPFEVLAYDDVEVEVDLPEAEASLDAPVRVVVSSDLDEGRTIVLNLDEALLASNDPGDLVLRYFDLHNQTDGSIVETEVVFHAAASLQDVLDPADDTGQPEYWVVQDANGVQVLVSVPHWSAHAITVASFIGALDAPSVLVGISVGAGMTIALGMVLLWPRRRQDDF